MRTLDAFDLARALVLADLVLQPIGAGWLRPAVLAVAVLGLVLPAVTRRAAFWLGLAALAALRVYTTWPLADNHAYLLIYACLAIAIALRAPEPQRALASSARLLIGLVFAFAVLWKAISPDFLDNRFFRVTLVLDTRLEPFTTWVGGLDGEALQERRDQLAQHVDREDALPPLADEPARFRTAAWAATLGTFASELALALAFLWPPGRGPSRLRDPLLIAFCAATYLVAPVSGFGWLLIALAVAQTAPDAWRTRAVYLGVFALVFLYGELETARMAGLVGGP